MRDQITTVYPNNPYILNLDTSAGSGTHWTTFMLSKKTIQYFDSFGMPPPQELVDYASKHKLAIKYNQQQYQNVSSVACGYFAMYVAKSMYEKTYPSSLDILKPNADNDKILYKQFN